MKNKAFAVIGMRRAGKTTFLHQCRADLLASDRTPGQAVYFNFEDERLGELEGTELSVIPDAHARLFPEHADAPVTFFFDEIQRVAGWEVFVRRLLDTKGYSIFVSGSSARMLSREVATSMRGRAWEIVIHPFGFGEYLRHHGIDVPDDPSRVSGRRAAALDHHVANYLETGGFPEAQELQAGERRELLQNYVDVVLFRDIIERHAITNTVALRWMVRRLLGNPAGSFSVTRFFSDLRSQGIAVGRELLHEMLGHLGDAFLVHTVGIASDSEKRRQVNPRKAYPADPALIAVFDRSGKPNVGHALETMVLVELLRRKADVSYVKTASGYEVDFHARSDSGSSLIQVCASVDDPATLEREVRALQDAANERRRSRMIIVTLETRTPFPEVPKGIEIVPAWRWMLETA